MARQGERVVDTVYLKKLSTDALPVLTRLLEDSDPKVRRLAGRLIPVISRRGRSTGWPSFNFSRRQATRRPIQVARR